MIPIYILVQTSASFVGEKMEKVIQCLEKMREILAFTLETSHSTFVSLILFNSSAETVISMEPLRTFQIPPIVASSETEASFASVISALMTSYDTDIVKTTSCKKADSILVMFSDGILTDEPSTLQTTLEKFNSKYSTKFANGICCYINSGTDSKKDQEQKCDVLKRHFSAMFHDVLKQEESLPDFIKAVQTVDDLSLEACSSLSMVRFLEEVLRALNCKLVFKIPYLS